MPVRFLEEGVRAKMSSTLTIVVTVAAVLSVIGLAWAVLVPSLLRARVSTSLHGGLAREATDSANTTAERLAAMAATRMLVRTGQLTLEVARCETAAHEVERVAARLAGYVADSRSASTIAEKPRGTVTIRVAASSFDAAVTAVKALGRVRSESVSTQDVTKAYVDLEARIGVKRETEARLRQILRDRTARLSDVVGAERELGRVIEEIEQAEGERRFYDHQVALSTLEVTLEEPGVLLREAFVQPVAAALRGALPALAESLAVAIYVVASLIPWLPLLALAAWVMGNRRARRHARATEEAA